MISYEEEIKRYEEILGVSGEKIVVSMATLRKYIKYLQKELEMPCELTGIDDFQWEEYYVLGPGDSDEYEKLKKTRPSYTDTFKLIAVENDITDKRLGIMVSVRRGRQKFYLPLQDLEATDKKSLNYKLIDEYCSWIVNY
ncbi:MAG: hypothetical protein K9M99_02910 [Candidatus Cloacimonetes bacterium]|nr:hypothetical protein [Candidatus Cloacimonadota bacterium]